MLARALAPLLVIACALAGCGGGGSTATPAALRLQREDFVAASRALTAAQPSVARAVTAARVAWPLVVNGLPADTRTIAPAPISRAAAASAAVGLPAPFDTHDSASLTGSAAKIAGVFHNFSALTSRGWRLIGASIAETEHGSPASARFARANVALYIESVYDGHSRSRRDRQAGGRRLRQARRPERVRRLAHPAGSRRARERLLEGGDPAASTPRGYARRVSAFVTAGAGFLLAVLWFDLMFDTQVLGLGAERDAGRSARAAARLDRRLLRARDDRGAADEPARRRRDARDIDRARSPAPRQRRANLDPAASRSRSRSPRSASREPAPCPAPCAWERGRTRSSARARSRARSCASTCSAPQRSRAC